MNLMAEEIRVSRPVQQQPMQSNMGMSPMEPQRASKMPWIILGVVILVLVILGVLFRDSLFKSEGDVKGVVTDKASGYQAVFLTNGQVYFGKITSSTGDYVTLKDIYYLQVTQPPLQGSAEQGQPAAQQQPQISLVKLGNELHGPVDEMHISKAQLLFYEDIKEEGQVVKAIKDYQANPTGTPAQ
jgi:hypothetical protein